MTLLCDYGTRYQSKMFNPAFLREKGLPVPKWLEVADPHPEGVRRGASLMQAFAECRLCAFAFVALFSLMGSAIAEDAHGLPANFADLAIACDTTELLNFTSDERPPDILPVNRQDCEAAITRNGKPDLGKILLSIASPTEANETPQLSDDERRKLAIAERERAKTLLRPVLNICLELLQVAPKKPGEMSQRACLFALPRSSRETRALSDRLLGKPEEYTVCAEEPVLPAIRPDHPLRDLAGAEPLTWNRLVTLLAKDAFVCGKGERQDETCGRYVPMVLTEMPNDKAGEPSTSILVMRSIRVYRGQWRLAGQQQQICNMGVESKWCQTDKPPYGDSAGICVEPEDFHVIFMGGLVLAP